ncbi:MAG: acetylxylan esterase [Victivallaceae bacterium]|nr:acetylxylan esterase [Victivallaceae bacterium]
MKKMGVFPLLTCAALTLSAHTYLIEAERLGANGEFAFVNENPAHESGSTHLYGREVGTRISGKVEIPRAGKYDLYLRNQSYGDNARRMRLRIDGKLCGEVGDEEVSGVRYPCFVWSKCPEKIELSAGVHFFEIETSGMNTRPDALLLTDDRDLILTVNEMPRFSAENADGKITLLKSQNAPVFPRGVAKFNAAMKDKPFDTKHCSDTIGFVFDPTLDGSRLTGVDLRYTLSGDDGKQSGGVVHLEGKPVTVETTLDKPGFVCLSAEVCNPDGSLYWVEVPGAGPAAYRFLSCAGADEKKIPQCEEPRDFDAFWDREKSRLKEVPLKYEMKEVAGKEPEKYKTFAVSVDCPGPRPVTGYLVMPRDAAAKSLPATVKFQGYGLYMQEKPEPPENMLFFEINAHGFPLEKEMDFYTEFFRPLTGYALNDGADPRTCYFNAMVLRVLRALEFVRALPEWNGRDLMTTGGSQGGLQSLWAAALDDRVTFCRVRVPWGCNIGGSTLGLMPPRWGMRYFPGLNYYDAAFHAKRIHCPVDVYDAGLGDFTCPPSGIARMYHNLASPRRIVWYIDTGHGFPADGTENWEFKSADFAVPAAFETE